MSATTHTPFCPGYEHMYQVFDGVDDDKRPPALLINADASPMVLAAAAHARAERLSKSLNLWVITEKGDATAIELANTLEPLAMEIDLLMNALMNALRVKTIRPAD